MDKDASALGSAYRRRSRRNGRRPAASIYQLDIIIRNVELFFGGREAGRPGCEGPFLRCTTIVRRFGVAIAGNQILPGWGGSDQGGCAPRAGIIQDAGAPPGMAWRPVCPDGPDRRRLPSGVPLKQTGRLEAPGWRLRRCSDRSVRRLVEMHPGSRAKGRFEHGRHDNGCDCVQTVASLGDRRHTPTRRASTVRAEPAACHPSATGVWRAAVACARLKTALRARPAYLQIRQAMGPGAPVSPMPRPVIVPRADGDWDAVSIRMLRSARAWSRRHVPALRIGPGQPSRVHPYAVGGMPPRQPRCAGRRNRTESCSGSKMSVRDTADFWSKAMNLEAARIRQRQGKGIKRFKQSGGHSDGFHRSGVLIRTLSGGDWRSASIWRQGRASRPRRCAGWTCPYRIFDII